MPKIGRNKPQLKELEIEKKKKDARKNNKMVTRVNEANDLIANDFLENFDSYVEQQKAEFKNYLDKYVSEHEEELKNTDLARRLSTSTLQNYLCKPFISSIIHVKKYNAKHLQIASDYYWDKVAEMRDNHIDYIPTFQQFARLLNVSVQALKQNYINSEEEEMRETISMIRDRFVDFYTEHGMKRQISEVMSIFMLKSEYNMRDNDTPQTVINNNNFTIKDNSFLKELQEEESKNQEQQIELMESI